MLELDYTWVAAPTPAKDSSQLIRALGPYSQDQLSVSTIRTTPAAARDLIRDTKTLSVTATMPVGLIQPSASEPVIDRTEEKLTWGVKAVRADTSPYTGAGVSVAVLDTGVDPEHQAFQGRDLLSKDFSGDNTAIDGNGHGTHCAGTIAGNQVDGLRIGVAEGISRLLSGKVLDSQGQGSTTAIIQGVQWASMNQASIISMSLGLDFTRYVEVLHEENDLPLRAAVSLGLQAYRENVEMFSTLGDSLSAFSYVGQGALIVAAAGNESQRPAYTIAASPPAVADSIVSVAALDKTLHPANFSNTFADISAPGVSIVSARLGGGLSELSGTSMAAPHVVGVAALWAQKLLESNGDIPTRRLRELLWSTVVDTAFTAGEERQEVGVGMVAAPQL